MDLNPVYFQVNPFNVLNILLETLLCGGFLVLFVLSTMLLLRRRRVLLRETSRVGSEESGTEVEKGKLRSVTLYIVIGILMFLTISSKWAFYIPEILPIPSEEEFNSSSPPHIPRLSSTAYRIKEILLQLTVLLGDFLIIYRLWVLSSQRKLIVAFPVAGIFAFLVCAIALDGPYNDTENAPIPVERGGKIKLLDWDVAATAVTLSINVYSTTMISWIILRAQFRSGLQFAGHGVMSVLAVIVESSAISATCNLLFFISGLGFSSEMTNVLLECLPVVYGISAMLINVRVGLGFARGADGADGMGERECCGHRFGPRGIPSTLIITSQGETGPPMAVLQIGRSRTSSLTRTLTESPV